MHRPKETKDIYEESLSVNSSTLQKQLTDNNVRTGEIDRLTRAVADRYAERLRTIVVDCEQDMMALERVPSPLRLFIDCLMESSKSLELSSPSRKLIDRYASAWEDWM